MEGNDFDSCRIREDAETFSQIPFAADTGEPVKFANTNSRREIPSVKALKFRRPANKLQSTKRGTKDNIRCSNEENRLLPAPSSVSALQNIYMSGSRVIRMSLASSLFHPFRYTVSTACSSSSRISAFARGTSLNQRIMGLTFAEKLKRHRNREIQLFRFGTGFLVTCAMVYLRSRLKKV